MSSSLFIDVKFVYIEDNKNNVKFIDKEPTSNYFCDAINVFTPYCLDTNKYQYSKYNEHEPITINCNEYC